MIFIWDPRKAAANLKKHRVDFREAASIFSDVMSATFPDEDHSDFERRFLTLGQSPGGRVLVVAHTETEDEIRIISAREATKKERKLYEEEK